MTRELPGARWRKSSRSSGGENNCVEVAFAPLAVGIRDTKDRAAGHLEIGKTAFGAFLETVTSER
jgi:uncharacterized protein DUF397